MGDLAIRFELRIVLGNDAMTDRNDLANALSETAKRVRDGATGGPILDANGNGVGHFKMEVV